MHAFEIDRQPTRRVGALRPDKNVVKVELDVIVDSHGVLAPGASGLSVLYVDKVIRQDVGTLFSGRPGLTSFIVHRQSVLFVDR